MRSSPPSASALRAAAPVVDRFLIRHDARRPLRPSRRSRPPQARSLHRRRSDRRRGVEDRVADGAAERHRRAAGHHRPRDGRPLRRLHRQRRHRRQLADLPRRHRLHQLAVHRHGRAGLALCRRERSRQSQPHRLPGIPHRARPGARHPGADRLRALALAARDGERDARGAGRSAALSADDVPVQHRHADVLHAGRRAARGG